MEAMKNTMELLTRYPLAVLAAGLLLIVGAMCSVMLRQNIRRRPFLAMRNPNVAPAPGSTPKSRKAIRATDLSKLNRQQSEEREGALRLIAEGHVKEGAIILERLELHRDAIAALESAGLIDDACGVLMRMGRPNRAAEVFRRNGRYAQAATLFEQQGMKNEAAACYLEAAKENADASVKAADILIELKRMPEALRAYATAGDYQKVYAIVLESKQYGVLRDLLREPQAVKDALEKARSEDLHVVVKAMPNDLETVTRLAQWSVALRRIDVIEMSLKKFQDNAQLAAGYWSLLPDDFAGGLVRGMCASLDLSSPQGQKFLSRNGRALYQARKFALAAPLYERAGRSAMTAKCLVLAGDLEAAAQTMRRSGADDYLAQGLETLRDAARKISSGEISQPSISQAMIYDQAQKLMANIDPDGDEHNARSPFSMSA